MFSVAVARGEGAHAVFDFLAAFEVGEQFDQAAETVVLVAHLQEGLLGGEVGEGLGELEAEQRGVEVDGEALLGGEGFLEGFRGAAAEIGTAFGEFVVEELDAATEEGAFVVEGFDFEAASADGEDVEAAVFVLFEDVGDVSGAAGVDESALDGEDDAEFGLTVERLADHLLVTVLEDVEREAGMREQHDAQREEREQCVRHATIMAACDNLR